MEEGEFLWTGRKMEIVNEKRLRGAVASLKIEAARLRDRGRSKGT